MISTLNKITETLLKTFNEIWLFFSDSYSVLGSEFTGFELVLGSGVVVILGYWIVKWLWLG